MVIIFFAIHNLAGKKRLKNLQMRKSKVERFRECPECFETIQIDAKVCRYCHKKLAPLSVVELERIQAAYLKKSDSLDEDEMTS